MPSLTLDILLAAVSPIALGAASWAIKRWIGRVDAKIEALGDLRTRAAVAEERFSGLLGALDSLRLDIKATNKDVGRLTAAVDKLWVVLQMKGLAEPRASDSVLDKTGSGK